MIRQIHDDRAGRPAPVERARWRRFHPRMFGLALIGTAALTAVGAVVLPGPGALTARPVMAATGTPSTSKPPSPSNRAAQYCQDFIRHMSTDLGISTDRVQAAMIRAARQTLDDAVVKGDLTKSQADTIKARLGTESICNVNFSGLGWEKMAHGAVLSAAAKALHISPDQLHSQLSQGKTVSEIAPAGMTEQQFASSFESNLKTELDAQVKSGNVTPAQESQALKAAPSIAARLWNEGAPWPHVSPTQTGVPTQPVPSP